MIFCLRRNLCGLTYVLYMTLDRDSAFAESRQGLVDKFCTVFPLVLVVLAYIFDSDDNMDPSKVNPNPKPSSNPNPNSHPYPSIDSNPYPNPNLYHNPNPNPNPNPNSNPDPNANSYPNPTPNPNETLP